MFSVPGNRKGQGMYHQGDVWQTGDHVQSSGSFDLQPQGHCRACKWAKGKNNKLNLGDINGIPRVLDAGQCNDSYSLALISLKFKEVFGLEDINDLPISYDIGWYEKKAVAVFLALLFLGGKGIRLGSTLPAFVSPAVLKVLIDRFDIKPIGDVDSDIAAMMQGR